MVASLAKPAAAAIAEAAMVATAVAASFAYAAEAAMGASQNTAAAAEAVAAAAGVLSSTEPSLGSTLRPAAAAAHDYHHRGRRGGRRIRLHTVCPARAAREVRS